MTAGSPDLLLFLFGTSLLFQEATNWATALAPAGGALSKGVDHSLAFATEGAWERAFPPHSDELTLNIWPACTRAKNDLSATERPGLSCRMPWASTGTGLSHPGWAERQGPGADSMGPEAQPPACLGGSFGSRPWPVNRLITPADTYGREAQEIRGETALLNPLQGSLPTRLLPGGMEESRPSLFFGLIRDRTHPMIYRRPRILNELYLCLELRASPGSQLLSIKNKRWLCLFWTICLSSLGRFP